MIFQGKGYPGVLNGEFGYFQAVLQMGFKAAHSQMLGEVRAWMERNRPYQSSFMIALEAYQIHQSFARLVINSQDDEVVLTSLDQLFADSFGYSGRAVLEGEKPRSRFLLENTLGNWKLPRHIMGRSKAEIISAIRSN